MSEIKSFDELRQLPECVLFEVVREAELLIQAQLTCAIAADQRALTFAGFLITAATAAFGGGVALAMTDHRIAITALAVLYAGGLSYAAYLASESARPNLFCFPGNYPRSEEHTSELQSIMRISYAVYCLKKKKSLPLYPRTS